MPRCDHKRGTGWALVMNACVAALITGCMTSENQVVSTKAPIDIFDPVRRVDVASRNAPLANLAKNTESSEPKHSMSYYGEDNALVARVPLIKDAKPEATSVLPEPTRSHWEI